jgi:hypothetical protein
MVTWLASCAQQSARGPRGGPKDETPPSIDTVKSTPNLQTNFSERKIELVFDEWIQTRSLISKVLISPPLQYLPKLETRGKKITIEFNEEEVLREDATYIFNLGDAVADFREGNKMDNLTFVFSTGDVIDSLGFGGIVVDALTGKPVQDCYVMLHDEIQDSIVYQKRPFYFVNTNKEGKFQFNNIRADTFLLFALKDGNVNYTYDEGVEEAGFIMEPILLTPEFDSSFTIEVSIEEQLPSFSRLHSSSNGIIKLGYKNPLFDYPEYLFDPDIDIIHRELDKDTLKLWYVDTMSTTLYVDEDTIVLTTGFSDAYLSSTLSLEGRGPGKPTLSPKDSLEIMFTNLIESIIVDSIRITDTAGIQKSLDHKIEDQSLKLKGSWNRDSLLNVFIPPGTITDIHGRSNDTIEFTFLMAPLEKYGDIIFTLKETASDLQYHIQLMRGGQIYDERITVGTDSTTVTFVTLPAGDYEVTILEDRNGDGRWTPGRYIDKRLPEDQITLKLDALRENWELQARYNWRKKAKE